MTEPGNTSDRKTFSRQCVDRVQIDGNPDSIKIGSRNDLDSV